MQGNNLNEFWKFQNDVGFKQYTYYRDAENITIHYDYNPDKFVHDIAIIRLSKPLTEEELKVISLACILSDVDESRSVIHLLKL